MVTRIFPKSILAKMPKGKTINRGFSFLVLALGLVTLTSVSCGSGHALCPAYGTTEVDSENQQVEETLQPVQKKSDSEKIRVTG